MAEKEEDTEVTRRLLVTLARAPSCCKNLCCASCFCTGGGGAGGSSSKNVLEGDMKQMLVTASPGTHPEAPGRSSGTGHQHHQKPENQDSQHTLNQSQGVFP